MDKTLRITSGGKCRTRGPWAVRTVVVRLSRKLTATYHIPSGRLLSRLLAAMLSGFANLAVALPAGVDVVAGQASVSTPTANSMLIQQGSDKAILNWQSFNIGAGQSVQFVQPGAASVALNRVTGANPSAIYGSLSANGQVFLINPAGVMFAPGAQVNVGGLVASSLAISNEDFVAGRYSFSSSAGGNGSVINHGSINAARGGYVLLAAPSVSNTGSITTIGGATGLVAGSRVSLDTSGAGLVRFSVDAAAVNAVAANSGVISAQGGQVAVLASALGDAMATVINQTGVIRATSATERNGMIVLSGGASGAVNVSGTLDASGSAKGQTGGTVHVLGDKVALTGAALVNVSGDAGGGTVLIGGNYQGMGTEQNASATFVGSHVVIDASAGRTGNGGMVVVWSDDTTRFGGTVSGRGGSTSGDGGLTEVSGKHYLDYQGFVDLGAASGNIGTLLLDPSDITISNAASSGGLGAGPTFQNGTGVANLNVGTLLTQLGGANVIVNTTPGTGGAGNITVSDAIAYTGGTARTLTLNAGNSIDINAAISSTASALTTNLNATAATTFSAAGSISTNGGNVAITGTGAKILGSINTTGATGTGNLTVGSTGSVGQTASSALVIKGATTVAAGAANDITLSNAGNNFASIGITSGKDVSLTDSNALALATSTVAGSLTINAGGSVTQTGGIVAPVLNATLAGAGSALTLATAGNNITQLGTITTPGGFTLGNGNNAVAINGAISTTNAAVALTSGTGVTTFGASGSIASGGGNVTLTNSNAAKVLGNIDTTGGAGTGNFTVTGAGVISQTAGTALKVKGTTTMGAGAGNNVTLNNAGNDFTGAVSVTTGLNVGITDSNALVLGTSTVSGTLGVNTSGAITQTGALVVTGATTLTAGAANDITLNTATNNFASIGITSGNNVSLRDSNALAVAASNVAGALTLTAGGAITQTGAITAATLTAKTLSTGSAITLNHVANDVATVDLRARNGADTANANGALSYRDANGFDVAAVNTAGTRGAITAASLAVPGTGSGSLHLDTQANNIATLNAITAAAGFALNNGNNSVTVNGAITTTNGAVAIDAGTGAYAQNNVDIDAGAGSISVTADTVSIATNTASNALRTSGVLTIKAKTASRAMSLGGASGFDLSTGEIASIAAGATGPIVIGDTSSSGILTIGNNIGLGGKTVTLNAGSMTDTGTPTISALNVTLNANGQIGTSSANGIDIAATNLNVNTTGNASAFVRTGAINLGVGTSASSVGSGTLDLTASGAVTQTATTGNITAGTLKVQNLTANAPITLTNSGNNATTVNLRATGTGAIQYTSSAGFDVAAVATGGNATLSSGGSVTQSGAIGAAGLALTGTGGAHTLRHTGNAVTTLAANTGSVDYSQAGALAVGTVAGVVGVTTTGTANIETTGAASDLTLNNAVTSGASGDAVVLKAGSSNAAGTSTGGQFIMGVGGSIAASAGRYLVYSGDPGVTTEGVTGYSKRYNTAATFTPGGSNSMFLYRVAPTLTISSDNATKTYGQVNPVFTGNSSGYIDGDTAASVGVTRTSAAVFNTPVAQSGTAITSGATNNENYTLVLSHGALQIDRASISSVGGITANNKTVDGNTSATLNTAGATFAGIVPGDVLTASGIGNFDTPFVGANKLVFIKDIILGGAAADNYTLADNTATARAAINSLANFTAALLPAAPQAPVVPATPAGLTVADANALLEQAPTASGGCQDPDGAGAGCVSVTTVREASDQAPGLVSVVVAGVVTGFQFTLPSGPAALVRASVAAAEVLTIGGRPLPDWLRYDAAAQAFVARDVPAGALPMQIRVRAGNRSVILTIARAPGSAPAPGGVLVQRLPASNVEKPG